MIKKLQCQDCGQAEYGEDLYNYDNKILCRYCIVSRVCEGSTPCEYVGTCNDKTCPNNDQQIDQLKQQLEEKNKEIARYKQELEQTNAGYDFIYEQSGKTINELKQLAITELEKVEEKAIEHSEKIVDTVDCIQDFHSYITIGRLKRIIDQQIKDLKGE